MLYRINNLTSLCLLIFYYSGTLKFALATLVASTILIYSSEALVNNTLGIILVGMSITNLSLVLNVAFLNRENGWMESVLVVSSGFIISISNFLALFFSNILMLVVILPVGALFYGLEIRMQKVLCCILICGFVSSLVSLCSSIQQYFSRTGHMISVLILPLILPIIMIGATIDNGLNPYYEMKILTLLAGADLVVIPISILTNSYLSNNMYNFE